MPPQRGNAFEKDSPKMPVGSPDLNKYLHDAAPRQRSRRWEKANLSQKATYRGIDPNLALRVKQIAAELNRRDGDVARTLLEYAMRAYAEGDLDLNPHKHPDRMRNTLFPFSEKVDERRKHGEIPPRKKKLEKTCWRVVTTWRGLPAALKQEIATLGSEDGLNIPSGELVTALLGYSLKAYAYGLLKVEPVEEAAGYNTLVEGDE
jgi:hypothetical protein